MALTVIGFPTVTVQPTNNPVAVAIGSNVTFSVSVTGTGTLQLPMATEQNRLPNGFISTVAGNGTEGYSGDGGPATNAEFFLPYGVAVDAADNLFIADFYNNRVRKVEINGIITTVVGNGLNDFTGDGGPATSAELNVPLVWLLTPAATCSLPMLATMSSARWAPTGLSRQWRAMVTVPEPVEPAMEVTPATGARRPMLN